MSRIPASTDSAGRMGRRGARDGGVNNRRGRLRTALFVAIGLAAAASRSWPTGCTSSSGSSSRPSTRASRSAATWRRRRTSSSSASTTSPSARPACTGPSRASVEAKVIDRLAAAGAKVIAEDIQYTERTTPMPGCGAPCVALAGDEDQALADVDLQRGPEKVEGRALDDGGRRRRQHERPRRRRALVGARRGQRQLHPRRRRRDPPLPATRSSSSRRFRSWPPSARSGACSTRQAFPTKRLWIDFAGPPGRFRSSPSRKVLRGKFDPAVVRGKIVVVGVTAPRCRTSTRPRPRAGADVRRRRSRRTRSTPCSTASRSGAGRRG